MTTCPMCRQPVAAAIDDLIAERAINGHQEAVLRAVWEAAGRPVKSYDLFDAMYEDDPDGGPTYPAMYAAMYTAATGLNAALAGSGVAVYREGKRGWRLSLAAAA